VIRVARRVQDIDPHTPLAFIHIGDGPQLEELRDLAAREGLAPPRLTFAGYRQDVRSLLAGCHFALHAAKGEGFSLASLEYLSAGLVTLVPDVPSVSQAIDSGRTGIVYPEGDVEAAAQLLARLCRLPMTELRVMGSAAAQEVRENYSLERTSRVFRDTIGPQLWTGE
jgi:glycosyltransferase involved in cell wall biosynthesis